MKKLLSLPPNLVRPADGGATVFHQITGLSPDEYFCTCDPEGHRIGSGGGTAWLLLEAMRNERRDGLLSETTSEAQQDGPFLQWLGREKRILVHAGGQSRRLPAYAPSGKILTPVPVFRWERGQRIGQDLLALQLPLYEQMMEQAPASLHTMVVSGDVLVRTTQPLGPIPEADVVCYGLWLEHEVARNHGVFVSDRRSPGVLKQMLQKPSIDELHQLQHQHYFLTDIGVWMLSDRAVKALMKRSAQLKYYDLYSDFGRALGTDPVIDDPELRELTVAILPLEGGEFYHFGTSRDIITSSLRLQNLVSDQRAIMHHDRKPHASIFVQNAIVDVKLTVDNTNVWIENSHIGPHWQLTHDHIITGVPRNDWQVSLAPGECIDVVPVGKERYAFRHYHIDSRFEGADQQRPQFVVLEPDDLKKLQSLTDLLVLKGRKQLLSAEQLSDQARLDRLFAQRAAYRDIILPRMAQNWQHSVFYQLDLADAARIFSERRLPLPEPLPETAPLMTRIHDAMFRGEDEKAFGLLREGLTPRPVSERKAMGVKLFSDQIVWGRSPVRIDIAGGWTDTPPYCLLEGGNVVNLAIELNGQPPIQTYIKPSKEPKIVLRSIDLGAREEVETWEQLSQYNKVGSPFSIPKAALALAGFLPSFSTERFVSLRQQLEAFGCGIELTLLSAIPAGSGLGTSSILAATVLGTLNVFCGLGWDKNEIGRQALILEQLLTTGGGWQDQFGGVLGGVKLLQTGRGFDQSPLVRWLPTDLYTQPEYAQCHLLYYTGITRTAKHILAEIVRRMFLNQGDQLRLLRDMKQQALDMYEAIQRQDFRQMGRLVRTTWLQNQRLDSGTNPDAVRSLTDLVDDLCLGYKLPGAGGGGYLYMVAKDPEAAARIKKVLTENRQHPNARFVDMTLSTTGLQTSCS